MTVKARKPGTSLKLCNIPISTPVKLAFSTIKLLSKAIQTENTKGMINAIASSKFSGERNLVLNDILNPAIRY